MASFDEVVEHEGKATTNGESIVAVCLHRSGLNVREPWACDMTCLPATTDASSSSAYWASKSNLPFEDVSLLDLSHVIMRPHLRTGQQ
jgi:hypothetical protein